MNVRSQGKTLCSLCILDVRNRLEKCARIFTYAIMIGTLLLICKMRDNADRIIESVNSGTIVFV